MFYYIKKCILCIGYRFFENGFFLLNVCVKLVCFLILMDFFKLSRRIVKFLVEKLVNIFYLLYIFRN